MVAVGCLTVDCISVHVCTVCYCRRYNIHCYTIVNFVIVNCITILGCCRMYYCRWHTLPNYHDFLLLYGILYYCRLHKMYVYCSWDFSGHEFLGKTHCWGVLLPSIEQSLQLITTITYSANACILKLDIFLT